MTPTRPKWLANTPPDWDVALLRLLTRVESGHTPSRNHPEYWVPDECVHPWFTLADIWQLREGRQKYIAETKERISDAGLANSAARLLPAGTVALSRTASVGFSGIMAREMATTQDFVNFVCGPRLKPTYLLWVLRGMKPEFDRLMMGSTHQTIYMPDLMQFRVPVPSLRAQDQIADFVDRKTAAIDALIEKKERLIALLAEKRAALIHQAVTKGLDPTVPMKPSGIPWIGDIPAHWDLKRLKHLSPKQSVGVVVNPSSYFDDSGTIPILLGSNVRERQIASKKARRISVESNRKLVKSRLRAGDLVVVRVGEPGVTAVVPPELDGCNCASVMFVRSHRSFDSDWLSFVMNSRVGRHQVELVQYGAAQKQFNIGHAVDFLYPTPPIEEQRQIASYLIDGEVLHDATARAVSQQVSLFREYRQALITAAVTGQLEIPEAAA